MYAKCSDKFKNNHLKFNGFEILYADYAATQEYLYNIISYTFTSSFIENST